MTHPRWPARRIFGALAAPLVTACLLIGSGPAAASTSACQSWTGVQPPSPGTIFNALQGVTVLSPCDAWTVGIDSSGGPDQTLIEHWDGAAWTVTPSPDPGSDRNILYSVRAVSPTDAWAVGTYSNGAGEQTLILHWDGTTWNPVPSPDPGGSNNILFGVRAVSPTDAWAVGDGFNVRSGYPTGTYTLHYTLP